MGERKLSGCLPTFKVVCLALHIPDMFGEHSPLAHGESSPLLSEGSATPTRYNRSPVAKRKTPRIRQSMPLVYTEFRSPEARQTHSDFNHSSNPSDDGMHAERTASPPPFKRAIHMTNLETFSSLTIWLLLLLPTALCCITYVCSTRWMYQTQILTVFQGEPSSRSHVLPIPLGGMKFVRSMLTADGMQSLLAGKHEQLKAHVTIDLTDKLEPTFGYQLLDSRVDLTAIGESWHPTPRLRGNAAQGDQLRGDPGYEVLSVPLPVVYLDYPLLSRSGDGRALVFTLNMSRPEPVAVSAITSADAPRLTTPAVSDPTARTAIQTEGSQSPPGTGSITLRIETLSKWFSWTVFAVQTALSCTSAVLCVVCARAIYHSACETRDKFISLEGRTVTSRPFYGAIDSVEFAETDAYSVHWWQFVLPEQFTVVFMLFFLSLWQGIASAGYALVVYCTGHITAVGLFTVGLVISVAQFGLLFCGVVYVDGQKYHEHGSHVRLTGRDALWQRALRHRESLGQSGTREFDPFAYAEDHNRRDSSGESVDDTRPEYWRRGSLGLRGYSSRITAEQRAPLTPLEAEYKRVVDQHVTNHHPCSREFLGFIHRKLIFLLITWVVCVLYWLLMYPRVWHHAPLSGAQVASVNSRFWIVTIVLFVLTLGWLVVLIQACFVTSLRLRRMKLKESRFRPVAFRVLMFQVEIALAVALCILAWHAYAGHVFEDLNRPSVATAVRYLWMWAQHYGLFRSEVVLNPPLAVHNAELLVLVSTIVGSIAYAMVPPDQASPAIAKRSARSFVTLQRLLPPPAIEPPKAGEAQDRELVVGALRQHLVNEEYRRFMALLLPRILRKHKKPPEEAVPLLCLEHALTYLEISYQTYFNADQQAIAAVQTGQVNASVASAVVTTGGATQAPAPKQHGTVRNPFDEGSPPPVRRNHQQKARRRSTNPFDPDYECDDESGDTPPNGNVTTEADAGSAVEGEEEEEPLVEPAPVFGPKINLAGLGYTLISTFSCDRYTTFGLLCEEEATGKLVVSFRGSLPGNAVTNLKFTQLALPRLKRSRNFFTALIRRASSLEDGLTTGRVSEAGSGRFAGREMVRTPTSELIPDIDPQRTAVTADEFEGWCSRVESADDGYEDDTNFLPPPEVPVDGFHDSELGRSLKSVGTAIPLVKQGFKRVHAGFWESYASIREDFLVAVVMALFEQRRKRIRAVQESSSVSPGASWYQQAAMSATAAGATPSSQAQPGAEGTLHAAIDGVRSLFASPFAVRNPFSPAPAAPAANGTTPRTPGANLNEVVLDIPELVLCGHSLGGAIASLAALELAENMSAIMEAFTMEECFNIPKSKAMSKIPAVLASPAPVLSLYTFGSPRVGNPVFAGCMEKAIPTIYRIQVNGDVVTMMPKLVGFYRHFGSTVILDEEETGSLIIDPTVIERSILQKSTGSVASHSLDKYRACLEACFEPDELAEYLRKEYRGLGGEMLDLPTWLAVPQDAL